MLTSELIELLRIYDRKKTWLRVAFESQFIIELRKCLKRIINQTETNLEYSFFLTLLPEKLQLKIKNNFNDIDSATRNLISHWRAHDANSHNDNFSTFLLQIPEEIKLFIFSFLDAETFINCLQVCHCFNRLCSELFIKQPITRIKLTQYLPELRNKNPKRYTGKPIIKRKKSSSRSTTLTILPNNKIIYGCNNNLHKATAMTYLTDWQIVTAYDDGYLEFRHWNENESEPHARINTNLTTVITSLVKVAFDSNEYLICLTDTNQVLTYLTNKLQFICKFTAPESAQLFLLTENSALFLIQNNKLQIYLFDPIVNNFTEIYNSNSCIDTLFGNQLQNVRISHLFNDHYVLGTNNRLQISSRYAMSNDYNVDAKIKLVTFKKNAPPKILSITKISNLHYKGEDHPYLIDDILCLDKKYIVCASHNSIYDDYQRVFSIHKLVQNHFTKTKFLKTICKSKLDNTLVNNPSIHAYTNGNLLFFGSLTGSFTLKQKQLQLQVSFPKFN